MPIQRRLPNTNCQSTIDATQTVGNDQRIIAICQDGRLALASNRRVHKTTTTSDCNASAATDKNRLAHNHIFSVRQIRLGIGDKIIDGVCHLRVYAPAWRQWLDRDGKRCNAGKRMDGISCDIRLI